MGNHLSEEKQHNTNITIKRYSFQRSHSVPFDEEESSHPSSSSFSSIRHNSLITPEEEEPIDDRFTSKLKDIESETKNSRDHGMNTLGLEKVHVGFVGFTGSGKTCLIRSILGCPIKNGRALRDEYVAEKRGQFKKSRSVHFSECANSQLIPYYFRRLNSIVLWEISYPFDIIHNVGEQERQLERREERLKQFFVDHHLNKFCLLFLCIDEDEPREEDLAFARAGRLHGTEIIFLRTKSDLRIKGADNEEERQALLHRERIIFESKLSAIASDLADLKYFFVSSKTIPNLIAESKDESIIAFRQMELIPNKGRATQIEMEGRRHTMGERLIDMDEEVSLSEGSSPRGSYSILEEEELMRFIVQKIDEFNEE